MRGTICLIGLGRPWICVITCCIGTSTCCIQYAEYTSTQKSLKLQFLIMIPAISSDVSLSGPKLSHYLRTQSKVIPLNFCMPWLRVNAEYSIHCVLHKLGTVYTVYCIIPTSNISCFQSVSSLGRSCCTQFSPFLQLQVNQSMESQLLSHPPPKQWPPDRHPPCTALLSLDSVFQVHLQSHSITASKGISKLTWSQPPSAFLILHDCCLKVCTIMAFKCISNFR